MTEKESRYFDMGDAVDDIKYSAGAKETALSALKFFGKSVYNVGCFAVTEVLPKVAEQAKQTLENEKAKQEEQRIREEVENPPEKKLGDKMTEEEREIFIKKQTDEIFGKPMK